MEDEEDSENVISMRKTDENDCTSNKIAILRDSDSYAGRSNRNNER